MIKLTRPILDYAYEKSVSTNAIDPGFGIQVADPPASRSSSKEEPPRVNAIISDGVEAGAPDTCCPVIETEEPANFSSAVLIASRLVLTANHSAPHSCGIRIPALHFQDGPLLPVESVHRGNGFDLALLVLKSPVKVVPARLADTSQFEIARESGVLLCGFGFTRDVFGNPSAPGIKRISRSAVPLLSMPLTGESPFNPDIEFIAGGLTATGIHDAETGDSGGPAFLNDGNNNVVVGIDSRNAFGHRSIFTRVDAHLSWIKSVAAAERISLL